MATMLIPGHDRDATRELDVNTALAMTDDELAIATADVPMYLTGSIDEYEPTEEDLATVRMFLAISDAPDEVGYEDARVVLDQLAYDEYLAVEAA